MKPDSLKERVEDDLKNWPNKIVGFAVGSVFVLLAILGLYVWKFGGTFSEKQDVWAQFGDFFGGVLNPVFSFAALLGLLFTISLQLRALKLSADELEETRKELKTTAEANKTIAEDNKANAIVDLYQIYTNEYFYKLSGAAWFTLEVAVKDYDYSRFLVTTFFVTEYRNPRISKELTEKIKVYFEHSQDVAKTENDNRHRLDELINFFNIIALRKAPKDVFERCDFFYDWYRPLLWWVCDLRLASYLKDPSKQIYCTCPNHHAGLIKLDEIYGFTFKNSRDRWEEFKKHPLVIEMKLDERHSYPFDSISNEDINKMSNKAVQATALRAAPDLGRFAHTEPAHA